MKYERQPNNWIKLCRVKYDNGIWGGCWWHLETLSICVWVTSPVAWFCRSHPLRTISRMSPESTACPSPRTRSWETILSWDGSLFHFAKQTWRRTKAEDEVTSNYDKQIGRNLLDVWQKYKCIPHTQNLILENSYDRKLQQSCWGIVL